MNIVTIDPSLTCTAVIVNDKKFIYASKDYGLNKSGSLKKWFKLCEPFITYRWHEYDHSGAFNNSEIDKLTVVDRFTDDIIDDIKNNIDESKIIVGIEGYSYSSRVGPLIDLVTLSTLLRIKIFKNITNNLLILPPTTLKKHACMLAYPDNIVKGTCRNPAGISGGSFKKTEMCQGLLDLYVKNGDEWIEFLTYTSKDIFATKLIPKPIEDVNDAKFMYEYLRSINIDDND